MIGEETEQFKNYQHRKSKAAFKVKNSILKQNTCKIYLVETNINQ